jgi:sigma-B regulation protein RsbU (phosphoserine phosphatase)
MFTDNSWDESSVEIGQEDGLVLYTDGVTEACNANGDLFGFEALVEAAQSLAGRTADEILNGIVRQVERHLGSEHQTDDIAMVVGMHTGNGPSSD